MPYRNGVTYDNTKLTDVTWFKETEVNYSSLIVADKM